MVESNADEELEGKEVIIHGKKGIRGRTAFEWCQCGSCVPSHARSQAWRECHPTKRRRGTRARRGSAGFWSTRPTMCRDCCPLGNPTGSENKVYIR